MVEIEIKQVKSVSYREIRNGGGERLTEITGRDLGGCRFRIVLRHDGRGKTPKPRDTER